MKQHDKEQKNKLERAARSLSEAMLVLETSAEIKAFLEDLCTPAEIEAMVDRWRVVQLLEEHNSYRQINHLTGVSVTTIGRVARFMQMGEGGYKIALNRLEQQT